MGAAQQVARHAGYSVLVHAQQRGRLVQVRVGVRVRFRVWVRARVRVRVRVTVRVMDRVRVKGTRAAAWAPATG